MGWPAKRRDNYDALCFRGDRADLTSDSFTCLEGCRYGRWSSAHGSRLFDLRLDLREPRWVEIVVQDTLDRFGGFALARSFAKQSINRMDDGEIKGM